MPTEQLTQMTETTEVLTPADTPDLEGMKRADVPAIWDEFKTKAEKLKQTAETLVVTDVSQVAEMKLARATRLALREVRVAMVHKHAELKESALKTCQKLDKGKRELLALIEPLEARMLECEEFALREAVRIEDEKRTVRNIELAPFLSVGVAVDLGKMSDTDYAALLADSRAAWEAKVERERKEKEAEAARVQAEEAERERIRLENERLKKEAEEREAAALKERSEAAERERAAAEKARKEREAADAAWEEKVRKQEAANSAARELDNERLHKEQLARRAEAAKAREEREAIEAKAKEQREIDERVKADLRKVAEAAERAIKEQNERIRAQIDAEKAAEERAAAAPDKEKLRALVGLLRSVPLPAVDSVKARAALGDVFSGLQKLAIDLELRVETL